jgi:superfamily I DNA/RNA helicase
VVGDDAQSIYAFRAATVRNILDFPSQFVPPAAIITLDRNYRSTQPILAAANGVIGLAAERFTKTLWTERQSAERPALVSVRDEADQARYVVEQVLENREGGTELKQQAVLFRTSSHSGPTEIELTRRNIPFVKFGGLKFLDTAHVKDLLALLRFVETPRDWWRVSTPVGIWFSRILRGGDLVLGAGIEETHGFIHGVQARVLPLAVLRPALALGNSGSDDNRSRHDRGRDGQHRRNVRRVAPHQTAFTASIVGSCEICLVRGGQ